QLWPSAGINTFLNALLIFFYRPFSSLTKIAQYRVTVASSKLSPTIRQRNFSGSGQKMKVCIHKNPGIYTKCLLLTKILQAAKKIFTILLAIEYF
ncbi:MAG: hypothetical protein SV775_17395, partial [Thermodesulfobacteriota bacterium]|nr:hypothetical protein [Thermodesulfobacteriota bacterium]